MLAAAQAGTLSSAIALTVVARGRQDLALLLTIVSNTATAVLTPLVLELTVGRVVELPIGDMMQRMALVVIAPVVPGSSRAALVHRGATARSRRRPHRAPTHHLGVRVLRIRRGVAAPGDRHRAHPALLGRLSRPARRSPRCHVVVRSRAPPRSRIAERVGLLRVAKDAAERHLSVGTILSREPLRCGANRALPRRPARHRHADRAVVGGFGRNRNRSRTRGRIRPGSGGLFPPTGNSPRNPPAERTSSSAEFPSGGAPALHPPGTWFCSFTEWAPTVPDR